MAISGSFIIMSDSVTAVNIGAYDTPYSGIGMFFAPMGPPAAPDSPVLHEAGSVPNNSNWNFPYVLSPFWRLYYNFEAGHYIELQGKRYDLLPDRVLLIPDHIPFHCFGDRPVRNLWLHFSLGKRLAPQQPVPVEFRPTDLQLQLIANLSEEIMEGTVEADRIIHRSLALIHLCISHHTIRWAEPLPPRLRAITGFIHDHLDRKLPNRLLASEAGISIETLCRLFNRHLLTSPAHYVNQARIRRAGHLLEHSDHSIEHIADLTGFPNRAYFSRVFKQISTLAPAEYRRRKRVHRSQFIP